MRRGGGSFYFSALLVIRSPSRGPGNFLLRAQKKVTKEKGAPVRRRYLASS